MRIAYTWAIEHLTLWQDKHNNNCSLVQLQSKMYHTSGVDFWLTWYITHSQGMLNLPGIGPSLIRCCRLPTSVVSVPNVNILEKLLARITSPQPPFPTSLSIALSFVLLWYKWRPYSNPPAQSIKEMKKSWSLLNNHSTEISIWMIASQITQSVIPRNTKSFTTKTTSSIQGGTPFLHYVFRASNFRRYNNLWQYLQEAVG